MKELVDDFILQNASVLQQIRYQPNQFSGYKRYLELKKQQTPFDVMQTEDQFIYLLCDTLTAPKGSIHAKNWIMDYDEQFVLNRNINPQSPVSLYTQEPTIKR